MAGNTASGKKTNEDDMDFSPMMKQYLALKEQYKDTLLFFRLGDFYEMFFEDALTASSALDIVLTERNCGQNKKAPMCGVPYHSADSYISRLVAKGYKVAICEQTTLPQKGKTLVERDVVRVITAGTVTEEESLTRDRNNFLCCVFAPPASENGDFAGAAWTDITTGEMGFCQCQSMQKLNELLSRLEPSEIVCNSEMQVKSVNLSTVKYGAVCPFSVFDETAFDADSAQDTVRQRLGESFLTSLKNKKECVVAMGALLKYIQYTQKQTLNHLAPAPQGEAGTLEMDMGARRNLELTQNISDGKKRGSLLWVLDKTSTAMGARLLRNWIGSPLTDPVQINARQDGVQELFADTELRDKTLSHLLEKHIKDIERISGRLSCGNISPSDCYSLGDSLQKIPEIKKVLSILKSQIFGDISADIADLENLSRLILAAVKNPSASSDSAGEGVGRSGSIINAGFDTKLDEYLGCKDNAKKILARLEQVEKDATGIKNLKVSFNKIIGFYIEVTKSNLDQVPYRYQRKGSTLNSERYITPELKEFEEEYLAADENAAVRELELYRGILAEARKHLQQIQKTANALARLDCLLSFCTVSRENNYTRPLVSGELSHIRIAEGRHPVVEKLSSDGFVPNDTVLDDDGNKIMLITGPNMAGKSIYMRQVALMVIMAQAGCFVPAARAEFCITDKIFTRIGAGDDVKTGRSTFMVEMNEVSSILKNAGNKSLILLDEVGRGTSTYDGLSIAWAILETLAKNFKSKVLFSTHYHELTGLEQQGGGIKNYKLTVREVGDTIAFIRKLMRGSTGKSFGIEVASLAGLPEGVIARSRDLLERLNSAEMPFCAQPDTLQKPNHAASLSPLQKEVFTILSELDLDAVSPRSALDILHDLKEKVKS